MQINIHEVPREMPDFNPENVEKEFCETLGTIFDFFNKCPLALHDEGITLEFAGRKFLLTMEVKYVREIT